MIKYLLICLILTGCATVDGGIVTDKVHAPFSVHTSYIFINNMVIPNTVVHHERFIIKFADGQCYTTPRAYKRAAIGYFFNCKEGL